MNKFYNSTTAKDTAILKVFFVDFLRPKAKQNWNNLIIHIYGTDERIEDGIIEGTNHTE